MNTLYQEVNLFDLIHAVETGQYSVPDNHLGSSPDAELLRLKGNNSQSRVNEYSVSAEEKKVTIESQDFSLFGEGSVLPPLILDQVIKRSKEKDYALRDFLNIFNHRLMSLYYLSWRNRQVQLPDGKGQSNSREILQYIGGSMIEQAVKFTGIFSQQSKPAQHLIQLLTLVLNETVEIKELQGEWKTIPVNTQTRLSKHKETLGTSNVLGKSAAIGKSFWSLDTSIQIVLHVSSSDTITRLLSRGRLYKSVRTLIDKYVPRHISYDVFISAKAGLLVPAKLSSKGTQLGAGTLINTVHQSDENTVKFKLGFTANTRT